MHKTLLLAAATAAFALGAGGAYATGGGNVSPEASPYAILEPQTVAPSVMSEGRAALTGGDPVFSFGFGGAPAMLAPPPDQRSISHGR
ncbi:MAG: hypothetical protein ACLQE9_22655 [Roseiarcus sp.]